MKNFWNFHFWENYLFITLNSITEKFDNKINNETNQHFFFENFNENWFIKWLSSK